jgi:hypothetical protein
MIPSSEFAAPADIAPSQPSSALAAQSLARQGSPDIPPHNAPKDPSSEKRILHSQKRPGRRPTRALSGKQLLALELLLAGRSDLHVCRALKLNRKTLYLWKHRHPIFVAEFDRRARDAWDLAAARLQNLTDTALDTVAHQLGRRSSQVTQLRAAKTLIGFLVKDLAPPTIPCEIRDPYGSEP